MTTDTPTSIDEYIALQPQNVQEILRGIRATIQRTLPEATEVISYGMPTFSLNGKHLIYFAAWKNHIGLYPLYTDGGPLKNEIEKYKREKDSIHLPYTEPFPYDLIEKFALFRRDEEAHRNK